MRISSVRPSVCLSATSVDCDYIQICSLQVLSRIHRVTLPIICDPNIVRKSELE